MLRFCKILCLLGAFWAYGAEPVRAADMDLHLVLAVDASSSINYDEFNLQMRGYANAFRDPALLSAIQSGTNRRIAITLMQWANPDQQKVVIPWIVIEGEEELSQLADWMENAPRSFPAGGTAIGDALRKAVGLFSSAPGTALRRVIDVSGDGEQSHGSSLSDVRPRLQSKGITVNGLAILNEVPELDFYYMEHVMTGAGAFVEPAADFDDFARAILRKLVREIRGNWYGS